MVPHERPDHPGDGRPCPRNGGNRGQGEPGTPMWNLLGLSLPRRSWLGRRSTALLVLGTPDDCRGTGGLPSSPACGLERDGEVTRTLASLVDPTAFVPHVEHRARVRAFYPQNCYVRPQRAIGRPGLRARRVRHNHDDVDWARNGARLGRPARRIGDSRTDCYLRPASPCASLLYYRPSQHTGRGRSWSRTSSRIPSWPETSAADQGEHPLGVKGEMIKAAPAMPNLKDLGLFELRRPGTVQQ